MLKRGISPLIATVLIIGFTVALGAVIMIWGTDFISGIQKGTDVSAAKSETCAATFIELSQIEQDTPNTLNFLLENLGSTELEAFTVRVTGEEGTDTFDVNQKLAITAKKQFHVNFDSAKTGLVQQVEVIPKVSVSGQEKDCTPGVTFSAEPPAQEDLTQWETGLANNIIDSWEECDNNANPQFPEDPNNNGQPLGCPSFGFPGGSLTCTPEGLIDTSTCTGDTTCGNGLLDLNEECDTLEDGTAAYINGITDCATLGTALEETAPWTGQIYCANDCMIDTTQCTTGSLTCGNGAIDQYEECDGTQLGTETCLTQGFTGGTLGCTANCQYDTSTCTQPTCGNGLKEGTEQCDGQDFGDNVCDNLGFHAGSVSCKADCTADTSACVTFTKVSNGNRHTCAISQTGDIYCWGDNTFGSLGIGQYNTAIRPKKVPGLSGVTEISLGLYHTCAVASGQLYCWGYNLDGELGVGNMNNQFSPTLVSSLTNPVSISAGATHTCAVASGQLYCWGYNSNGQIGDGTLSTTYNSPRLISGMVNPAAVAAGYYHTCATATNGDVYCWGYKLNGRVGNGQTTGNALIPIKISMTNAQKIDVYNTHSCATNSANEMYCWGLVNLGEQYTIPTKNTMANTVSISAGWSGSGPYSCATNSANEMYCWGYNEYGGASGDGSTGTVMAPQKINALTNVGSMSAGLWGHTCAVTSSGLYCWGNNALGQLGTGDYLTQYTPVKITTLA